MEIHGKHIPYNEVYIRYIELWAPRMAAEMHDLGATIEMWIGRDHETLRLARSDVTPNTFRNCFRRAGLATEPAQSASPDQDSSIGELWEELASVPDDVASEIRPTIIMKRFRQSMCSANAS